MALARAKLRIDFSTIVSSVASKIRALSPPISRASAWAISFVFGCSSFDADGIPVFGAEMGGLVIHELCHSYTNVLVDQIAAQLEKPAGALFATCADAMRRQAYADWKTMSYESLVRACVVRCRTVTESEAAGKKQRDEEVARGFAWVPALADEIGRFEADRKQWPTFADFLPAAERTNLVSVGRFALRGVGQAKELFTLDPETL